MNHRTFLEAASGRYWLTVATCTCGWRSRPQSTLKAAQDRADKHKKENQ